MPRTKPLTRNNRNNSSKAEHPPALQSSRKSRFGGLRLALPGLNSTTTTASLVTLQQVAIVSTKSSTAANHITIENSSVNDSSSWARWSQADKRASDENVNSTRKLLVPKVVKAATPRKRPSTSSSNIDNSRYILAVNQGRSFASNSIDPRERTISPQKPCQQTSTTVKRIPHTKVEYAQRLPQQQVEGIRPAYDEPTRFSLMTDSKPVQSNERQIDDELPSCDNPHLLAKKLTEYEYYLQRSANGGRLGIAERIDVFERQITSQHQKFDDLESIHMRPGRPTHDDDDTTTVMTMQTRSKKTTTSASIITQSPLHRKKAGTLKDSQSPEELMHFPQQAMDNYNEFVQFIQHKGSEEKSPKKQKTNSTELHNEQQRKSQVHRLIELKNSAEFLNEISSQVKNDHQMKWSNATKNCVVDAGQSLYETNNPVEVKDCSPSIPASYTRQQEPTEAEEIDRLLSILDPILRETHHNPSLQQQKNATSMSMKPPPLHNSPRKLYPLKNPRQHIRELGSQYSGSSDGEFNEKLKADAFAVFDDDNDDDIMIANPYHENKSSSFRQDLVDFNHTVAPAVQTDDTSSTSLDERQQECMEYDLSNSNNGSSDKGDDEIVKQYFQNDLDRIDFEMNYEASLLEQGLNPQTKNVPQSSVASEFGMINNPFRSETLIIGKEGDDLILTDNCITLQQEKNDKNRDAKDSTMPRKLKISSNIFIENDRAQIRLQRAEETLQRHPQISLETREVRRDDKIYDQAPNRYLNNSIPTRDFKKSPQRFGFIENYHPLNEQKSVRRTDSDKVETTGNFDQSFDDDASINERESQDESHSNKKNTMMPSPQLEKQGYASAPIRKYWQQYSNVRSGGSFDTISVNNEGSVECSVLDVTVEPPPSTTDDQMVQSPTIVSAALRSNKDDYLISDHHDATLDDDFDKFPDCSINKRQKQSSMVNTQKAQYSKTESKGSMVTALEHINKDKNLNQYEAKGIEESRNDEFSNLDLHGLLPVSTSGNEQYSSRQYHNIEQLSNSRQLYDDEGLCIHLSPPSFFETLMHVPINIASDLPHRRRCVSRPSIAIETERSVNNDRHGAETPQYLQSCVQDNLNSPETEFLIFTTASKLASQDLYSRVEKAISPTKASPSKKEQGSKYCPATGDCVNDGNNVVNIISTTDISRYKNCYYEASIPVTITQQSYASDTPHHVANEPRNELSPPYQTMQLSHDIMHKFDVEHDSTHLDQKQNEIFTYSDLNPHIAVKKYPSFDSDIAIAEDIVELLSMTSSEEIHGQDSLLQSGSDNTTQTFPILPPWHHENDIFSDTAPASHTSIPSIHGEEEEHARRSGRPQPGALDTNESVFSRDLPSPLRDTLIHSMSPMLSSDSHDDDTVSEWSSRYDQSRAGHSESFHQQFCSYFACFDLTTLEEQLRTICKYKRE